MPYFNRNNGVRILGTIEDVTVSYPITRDPDTGEWTYSGGECKVFDESAEHQTGKTFEFMFYDVEGNEVAESDLVWLD